MISADRPLKVVAHEHTNYYDEFRSYTCETVNTDVSLFDDAVFHIVGACSATWYEHNGTHRILSDGTSYKNKIKVKCMEPAVCYVHIPYAGGGGDYCEFHKPKIRSI